MGQVEATSKVRTPCNTPLSITAMARRLWPFIRMRADSTVWFGFTHTGTRRNSSKVFKLGIRNYCRAKAVNLATANMLDSKRMEGLIQSRSADLPQALNLGVL